MDLLRVARMRLATQRDERDERDEEEVEIRRPLKIDEKNGPASDTSLSGVTHILSRRIFRCRLINDRRHPPRITRRWRRPLLPTFITILHLFFSENQLLSNPISFISLLIDTQTGS